MNFNLQETRRIFFTKSPGNLLDRKFLQFVIFVHTFFSKIYKLYLTHFLSPLMENRIDFIKTKYGWEDSRKLFIRCRKESKCDEILNWITLLLLKDYYARLLECFRVCTTNNSRSFYQKTHLVTFFNYWVIHLKGLSISYVTQILELFLVFETLRLLVVGISKSWYKSTSWTSKGRALCHTLSQISELF